MGKSVINYWINRLRLLEAIKKDGGKLPFSVLVKNIFAAGMPLAKVRKELEEKGFIISEKHSRIVKTCITDKGEVLLGILKDLREVWNVKD